jgi:CRP/FNR family transcriptional regulator, cyclic AMP receptor protein
MDKISNLSDEQIVKILDHLDFFDRFTRVEKQKIVSAHTNYLVYQDGETLIYEGDVDKFFFILLSGNIDVYKESLLLPVDIDAGEFFGEMSFLTDTPRTATIKAVDRVMVIRVDCEMMEKMSAEIREKIKDRIIAKLIERLSHMTDIMEQES